MSRISGCCLGEPGRRVLELDVLLSVSSIDLSNQLVSPLLTPDGAKLTTNSGLLGVTSLCHCFRSLTSPVIAP
jgi:hypothetical protein